MKKLTPILLIIMTLFGCEDQNKQESASNDNIKILPGYNKISSLDELINQPQFKDKNLVINLYNRYCGSSTSEFNYLPELKKMAYNPESVIFIHLSTPKLTFTSTWKGAIAKYKPEGYHVLMNNDFYNEFWTNFSDYPSHTPFYLHVDKHKNISEMHRPSILLQMNKQRTPFQKPILNVFEYVQLNINDIKSTLDHNIETIDVLIDFDKDHSILNISFTTTKEKNQKERLQIPAALDSCIQANFTKVAIELDLKQYGFLIPLTSPILENAILQLTKQQVEVQNKISLE